MDVAFKDLITWAGMAIGFGTLWGKTKGVLDDNSKRIKEFDEFKKTFVTGKGTPLYVPQTTCREHRETMERDTKERFAKLEAALAKNTATTEKTHTEVVRISTLITEKNGGN